MTLRLSRRGILLASTALAAAGCASTRGEARSEVAPGGRVGTGGAADAELAAIEASVGGRLGVYALDTGSGRTLGHRADERFAMCSTFKWVAAAAVLARVDRGEMTLAQRLAFGEADLLEHAPVAREHLAEGAMTVETAARAVLTVSDNTAANLLLAHVGGPAGLTAFVRQAGDAVTRLDRTELTLNSNEPGDPRDTTSPRAMVGLMNAVLVGDVLTHASRERLVAGLVACETGKKRLRAGLPAAWRVGDRTGTGENMAVNDLAIAMPPGRPPVLVAVCMSEGRDEDDGALHEAGFAAVGRLVGREMGRG
jgi:beta-lactamase class A